MVHARPPVPNGWSDASLPHATCTVLDASHGVDGIPREKIRYIRIAQRLPWPYDNTFGGHRYEPDVKSVMVNWTPVRIIGTVPVEADGSARFRVPADTAVYFQILDEHHMELRRMRSFINFQKGEERGCVGCHETRAHAPPAGPMPLALRRDPSIPIPPPWGDRPVSFLRDVQPVFDRYCVKCHGGLAPAGGLDFSGGLTARHNRAYDTIQARGLVSCSNVGEDARITEPLAFGSHRSELVKVLSASPHRERAPLAAVDRLRLVMWIDANAPYYDAFINKRSPEAPYDPAADVALREKLLSVHGERCAACHAAADISRIDWIDLAAPGRSRFLAAPLPADQGGSGACGAAIYADAADPAYRSVHETITQAVSRAWRRPRRDLQALKEERGYGAVYGGR